ncbi:hypothetical protein EYZ11_005739 [Aspergillus tanneri]|uniref:Uncharacterized protein n=1 Tax=Aspergillus tanneri TaxID=1220188 RepID=A0A4S3JHE5_9EURO|nr:hypothetical protein EYZ11_005739 [Aspergillus tanneri]
MNTLEQVNATPPYATYADGSALRAVARDLVAGTKDPSTTDNQYHSSKGLSETPGNDVGGLESGDVD